MNEGYSQLMNVYSQIDIDKYGRSAKYIQRSMLHTKEYTKSDYYKAMSIYRNFRMIIVANSASFLKSFIFYQSLHLFFCSSVVCMHMHVSIYNVICI